MFNIGLHALHLLQGPAPHRRIIPPSQLRFGHLPSHDEAHNHRPNLHTEAEPFFHMLLHNGWLADALPSLVSILRDTVPVLEVLTCNTQSCWVVVCDV